ncbi:MAG: hypothetical protein ACKOZV_15515, partial [Bacteroidota bacterium]
AERGFGECSLTGAGKTRWCWSGVYRENLADEEENKGKNCTYLVVLQRVRGGFADSQQALI